jgi:hypothetical protein
VIVIAAVIADLCGAPPAPAEAPDPDDAAAYARAGDEARAAGDVRIAALAYRKAIALDPGDPAPREALAALCRADRDAAAGAADTAGTAGAAAGTAGAADTAGAAETEALLAAIARFRAGDDAAAGASLAQLAARGGAAAAGAHFFLGLLALRAHDGRRAERELALARRDPAYASLAGSMLRLARRERPLAALVIAAPELDTNPQLVPETPPAGAALGPPTPDAALLIAATVTARPWRWLVLREALAWRKQRRLSTLDFLGENAQAAVELDRGADHAALRYELDDDLQDGAAYLIASRASAAYRRDLGAASVGAGYAVRRRDYQQAGELPFDGWVHTAELGATVQAGPRLELDVRALGRRELTREASFSDTAGGGQAALRLGPYGRARAAGALAVWYARYDAPQPDGRLRRDARAEGRLDLELDLGDHAIAIAGATVERNDSTIEDFRYWKLVARVGIAIAFGGP